MKTSELQMQLAEAQATVQTLQQELAQTNRGLVALTMELEQRVDERTAELRAAHAELSRSNSDLLQLTMELEDRVNERTAKLHQTIEQLQSQITERMRLEEKINQLNAELEQRVADRTAQLQAANEVLESFSYSVSHDLRAPLRHIMGFADLLQKEAGPTLCEKSLSHLKTICQSAQRMGELIDELLAFSRVGRAALLQTDVNLDELVRETLDGFQAETKERNITWQIHPLPAVRADHNLLRQVLVNLISNAVKFTGRRAQAKIEIGCAPEANGETVIFVRDNGAGFDPRYAHKLFGVFQRLHSQEKFEGTGVGLANVLRIVRRHGGRAWAEGVVDGGATFYFSIPRQKEGTSMNTVTDDDKSNLLVEGASRNVEVNQ
jgi:light-regulated signal transduction histidine kinase (bacteriophytochrome)